MNFFRTIGDSIYSPEFYKNISKKTFGNGIRYFLLLIFFIVLIQGIILAPSLIKTFGELPKLVNNLVNLYPKDLELKIKNGEVSINQKEPYFIPFPAGSNEEKKNIAVIDTKTPFSNKKLKEYNTLIWLTKDSVFIESTTSQNRMFNLSEFKNATIINKKAVDELGSKISPFITFFLPIVFVFMFIFVYLFYLFKLLYLFILALLIFLVSKIFNWNFTYWHAYKVGLYAMTAGFLVESLISVSYRFTGFNGFPFMFTIISLIVVYINFSKIKAKASSAS